MRAGELDAELVQLVFVAFDVFEVGERLSSNRHWLCVSLHLSGGGKVVVIGRVELVEEVELARSGMLRGLLVNPLVELDARLLKLSPCHRVVPGGPLRPVGFGGDARPEPSGQLHTIRNLKILPVRDDGRDFVGKERNGWPRRGC